MTYHATDRMGATVIEPWDLVMKELLSSLDPADDEHPSLFCTRRRAGWAARGR